MTNPWEEISLSDYENHMKLDSVMQLQTMNRMMKGQLDAYSVKSVMILGIAGGNGLEHIVSCIIQIDADDSWVSDSPYLHAFGGLDKVHHQIEAGRLIQAMNDIGYRSIAQAEISLPNGKKLAQLDFVC